MYFIIYAMVTYNLRHVCGGRATTLIPKPYGGLTVLCKLYGDFTVFSAPQGHRKPFSIIRIKTMQHMSFEILARFGFVFGGHMITF